MNIGPILRGALGRSQLSEAKTLELRTGQVVRGTVLSVSEDGTEAVVEVQGVRLKAALETPLQQGQSMMMQVQPPGHDGLTVLKPLPTGTASGGLDIQVEQLLKNAGLEDTPDHRELVRAMQQAGLPVTKEQTDTLIKSMAMKPASVSMPEWVNAAAIAVQRGLPLSGEIITGLHQAIYGPPVHQLMASLEEQLVLLLKPAAESGLQQPAESQAGLLRGNSAADAESTASGSSGAAGAAGTTAAGGAMNGGGLKAASTGLEALLQRLQSVMGELRSELAAASEGVRTNAADAFAGNAAGGRAAAERSAAGNAAAQTEAQPAPSGAAEPEPARAAEPWLARVLKLLGAEHEQQAGRALLLSAAPKAAAESAPPGGAPSVLRGNGGGEAGGQAAPASQAPQPAAGGVTSGAAVQALGPSPAQAQAGQGAPAPAAAQPGQGGPAPATASAGAPGAGEPEATPAEPQAAADPAAETGRREGEAVRGGQAASGTQASSAEQAAAGRLPQGFAHLRNEAAAGALQTPDIGAQPASVASPAGGDDAVLALKDNLKGLLLQIIDTPDAPQQLQEAAKQMVQQLTGQQLLLNTDRTAPFAQVTVFLPFVGPDGGETATVQIQSRRGKKGELDPDNCRLWFDLNMTALGKLMVDVQVADKKVILQIHSEGEAAGAFLEDRHEEIDAAIQTAGYRLVAMRTDSYLSEGERKESRVSQSGAISYAPPEYKGVDYRI